MDSWPGDTRTASSSRKKKINGKEKPAPRNYPYLEQGTLGALTLIENSKNRFSWTSLVNNSPQDKYRFRTGVPFSVFPATRPPALNLPRASVTQRAEQGANFLRTFLPDVDVAENLIREYTSEDATLLRDFESFDPYIGNALEVIYSHKSKTEQSGYLAFPMGETRTDLNLSPFTASVSDGTKIEPSTSSVRTFHTPIRHMVSSSTATADMFLVVRTYGAIEFLQVNCEGESVSIDGLATFISSDLGNRPVVDMKLHTSPISLLLVDDHGSIYNCNFSSGQMSLTPISSNHDTNVPFDSFWRVGAGKDPRECSLISSKAAWLIDTRAKSRVELFNISNSRDMLTSVDTSINHNILLCSTNELLWIDKRYPKRPMLGYKHYREFDRYLTTQMLNSTSPLTFLTSRKNGLISVYDVSYGLDSLIHVNMAPYALSLLGQSDKLHIGQIFLPQLGKRRNSEFGLLRLGELGDISYVNICTSDTPPEHNIEILKSQAYESLEASAGELRTDPGPLSDQQGMSVDLSTAYDYIFPTRGEETMRAEGEVTENVSELLELLSDFSQNNEQPMEQMLTTYDVAFRAGEEPSQKHRTDFFTGSLLNSKRGYRAIKCGQLPFETLAKRAPWHYNNVSFQRKADAETAGTVEELEEAFKEYSLAEDEGRSMESMAYERYAREELIVDLVLSRDIFAPHPFTKQGGTDGALETMAEALSLVDEPPGIEFGYLWPTLKETDYYQKEKPEEREDRFTIGTKSLLKDWVVGTNPDDYVYHDPYNEASPLIRKLQPRPVTHTVRSQPPPIVLTQSQKPPVIAVPSTLEEVTGRKTVPAVHTQIPRMAFGSQVIDMGSSQEVMMSTQVLPGPYGGRPGVGVKKKVAKKRLGGF